MTGYMTRAMKSKDPRYARILSKLGYDRRDVVAEEPRPDDLAALREEYQTKIGKRPFNGWGADTLRKKIAEAGK
ncbi:hypothetical protein ACHFJ0_04980 [Paracoccus sp. NGMCC 1.201697]|uniref:Uncharacterized protein n=1 Tax=Paracoccus broussonetiae subsp. drimophilus TaxID=3373869 RepID=A0ABW7LHE2_9RHOB